VGGIGKMMIDQYYFFIVVKLAVGSIARRGHRL
jgi:hypothetical protein